MDLLPIRPVEFDWAWNTAHNGCKFTEIVWPLTGNVISMDLLPIRPGMKYCSKWASISMDLLPIWPVEFDRAWNTAQIGWNSLYAWDSMVDHWNLATRKNSPNLMTQPTSLETRISDSQDYSQIRPGMKYCSKWASISMDLLPIRPVKFDRAWNTAQIGLKIIVCLPGQIGYHLYGFTPNLTSNICPVEFHRAWNTAQNGCKFTEINCLPAWTNWVSFQWIQLASNSTGIYLNGFTPNSTGRISNSTGHEILLKMGVNSLRLIVCLPGRIGYHSNEFNWHLSQWIYSQFDQSNLTGHEILFKLGWNSWIYTQLEQYFRPGRIG